MVEHGGTFRGGDGQSQFFCEAGDLLRVTGDDEELVFKPALQTRQCICWADDQSTEVFDDDGQDPRISAGHGVFSFLFGVEVSQAGALLPERMNTVLALLPSFTFLVILFWMTRVYGRALKVLGETYQQACIPFRLPRGFLSSLHCWRELQPAVNDSQPILETKEALRTEVKRKMRYCFPVCCFIIFPALALISIKLMELLP
jgi:hypothetical protein